MKVKFIIPMASDTTTYCPNEIHEIEDGLALRLIENGTVVEEKDSEEVLELREKVLNLTKEIARLKAIPKSKSKK